MKRKPIQTQVCSFQQLCAIARALLVKDLRLVDGTVEWKAQIKDRVFGLGYQTPFSDIVHRAMAATEYAMRKQLPDPPSLRRPVRGQEQIPDGWMNRPELRVPRAAPQLGVGFESMQTILTRATSTRSARRSRT